ncbi:MAG: glycoside hydrolase family 3 N-terminal domain-containing protein, partial [Clostridia bacterium]|nr:glycoside hydrolase family 3 N-terminal domain-containing protein [Clostridia bacterium]
NKDLTAKFVELVVNTMNEYNVSSTLKHFPGYGNNIDTHTGIAIDKRPLDNFYKNDFVPFKAGINAKVQSVLVAHNVVESMDSKLPASISPKAHEILRNDLNFTGIIMTDDLAMDGIKTYETGESAAVLAVKAGNDMIISSDLTTQKAEVVNAVKSGSISEETINMAVKRILAWKYAMGIVH